MNIFWVEISLEKKLGRDLFWRDVVGRDSFADLFVEISLGSVLVKVEFFCFFWWRFLFKYVFVETLL